MDEGKAALYAAIIGFAAAIIGAAVGGWASWRAARHQVVGGAKNEHRHWVRQERRRAYGQVIQAVQELSHGERALPNPDVPPNDYTQSQDIGNTLLELQKAVIVACEEAYIFGPEGVTKHVEALRKSCCEFIASSLKLHQQEVGTEEHSQARGERDGALNKMMGRHGAFIAVCNFELIGEGLNSDSSYIPAPD
ncbi:hypothetical protein [Streptomyces inhibens]|uniref:hypothetical protein n=1 Tax=Streptomyces inhibens TaxID=2293571 RepID=UPI001EE70E72|nr:hypothetical protein [Streptomyces inhibens]UKY47869.1 hypothetical protein KI385_02860 [Streptomyces inhibens]